MRAAGIRALNRPVELLDLPESRPLADDEVAVTVRAAGVGNWDEFVRVGRWDPGVAAPMALGVEAAGVIDAVGPGAAGFHPGDEVLTHLMPLRQQGTWAERLIAPVDSLARKPPQIDWDVAAAFPVPALTALQVLGDALRLEPEMSLLVNGGGGVTGGLLVALGAWWGARVVATAGQASADRVRRLGAHEVVDYHDPRWPDVVRSITDGRGVDVAANAVPGGATAAMVSVTDGGRLATITSDPLERARGIVVSSVFVHPDGARLGELTELLATGRLSVSVGHRYSLAEAGRGLAVTVAGKGGGAVVVQP